MHKVVMEMRERAKGESILYWGGREKKKERHNKKGEARELKRVSVGWGMLV